MPPIYLLIIIVLNILDLAVLGFLWASWGTERWINSPLAKSLTVVSAVLALTMVAVLAAY